MGMPRNLWHPLTVLLVLAVLLGACAPVAQPTSAPAKTPEVVVPSPIPVKPSPVATPSGEQPRYGGILKSNNLEDPPHLEFTQVKSAYALQPLNSIYSMLVQNDPQDETKIIPDLAERWEVSPDGKVYTFYLRKGVKFHDGQPLTSADVKVSIERFAWPPKGVISQLQGLFQGVDRIETPDPERAVFVLKRPQASFLTIIAMPFFIVYPKHILDAKGDMKKDAVGTGPFKLKEYIRGVSFEQVKNTDYFVPGRPYLDGRIIYIIKDEAAVLSALKTRRIHLVDQGEHNMGKALREQVKSQYPDLFISGVPAPNPFYFAPNNQKKPWDDVRVRKAAWLAIDRQAAIQTEGQGDGVIGGILAPGSGWEIPKEELLQMPGYRQPKDADIAEAKRLLAEAGYPKGFTFRLLTRNIESSMRNATFVNAELAKIGVETVLDIVETGPYLSRLNAGEQEATVYGTQHISADPDVILGESWIAGAGANWSRYSNPKVDELYVKQSQTMDVAERKKLLRQLEQAIIDDYPRVNTRWREFYRLAWPGVRNYGISHTGYYLNKKFQDVWLAQPG